MKSLHAQKVSFIFWICTFGHKSTFLWSKKDFLKKVLRMEEFQFFFLGHFSPSESSYVTESPYFWLVCSIWPCCAMAGRPGRSGRCSSFRKRPGNFRFLFCRAKSDGISRPNVPSFVLPQDHIFSQSTQSVWLYKNNNITMESNTFWFFFQFY